MKTYIKFLGIYEESVGSRVEKKGPIITVSGLAGSGKTTVADWIAKDLNLKRFSSGSIFREIAKEEGVSLEELSRTRGDDVDHMTDKRTFRKGLEGGIVIDGRIAGWVMGEWADLRILVKCPAELRADRVAKRDKVSEKKAYVNVKARDDTDREKYLTLYGIDILDEKIYDLVIENSGSMDELRKQVSKAAALARSRLKPSS